MIVDDSRKLTQSNSNLKVLRLLLELDLFKTKLEPRHNSNFFWVNYLLEVPVPSSRRPVKASCLRHRTQLDPRKSFSCYA